jgi:hypothetical protein
MKNTYLTSMAIALFASIACLSSTGCATSNASFARTNSARSLTIADYDHAAKEIVDEILISPAFANFRQANIDKNGQMVILLPDGGYDNRSNDPTTIPMMKSFFEYLEEYSTEKGITYSNDLGKTKQIRAQDADSRYDQSTGKVTTGGASKSVISLEIIFTTQGSAGNSSTENEFLLRVKFIDAERGTTILSKSFYIKKLS